MDIIILALLLPITAATATATADNLVAAWCQEAKPPLRNKQLRGGNVHQFHGGPLRDHALRGTVYRNETTRSYLVCAVICLQEDACKSFNFCQDNRRCELNSAVYSEDKSDLQPATNCLYFDEDFHGSK